MSANDPKRTLVLLNARRALSNFVEAATCRNTSSTHAKSLNCTVLLDGGDTCPIRFYAATNVDFAGRTTGLDAERNGGKRYDNSFDQRWAGAAKCLDPTAYNKAADWLANLNPYCAVCVGHNAVELGKLHSASINIETACPLTKGFNRRVDL